MSLYIVPTPIGNLKDITLRAVDVLKNVNFIIAEDTRHSRKLLTHLGIHKKIISYYRPKERLRAQAIIPLLRKHDGALVSDSGTPLLSDPGLILVQMAIAANVPVTPLPGPTAFVPALAASGISAEAFLFLGFPPRHQGSRELLLRRLKPLPFTLIFYESPRRIMALLQSAQKVLGNRPFALAKEISKKNEKIIRGRLVEIDRILKDETIAGEMVLIIEGVVKKEPPPKAPPIQSMEDIYQFFKANLGISKNQLKKIWMHKNKKRGHDA